jgi:hypothetical protein
MTKEEILRQQVPADCIWEDMQHLSNTPFRYVFQSMSEYARQQAKLFAQWIVLEAWEMYKEPDVWCNPKDDTSVLTTEELYTLFLKSTKVQ